MTSFSDSKAPFSIRKLKDKDFDCVFQGEKAFQNGGKPRSRKIIFSIHDNAAEIHKQTTDRIFSWWLGATGRQFCAQCQYKDIGGWYTWVLCSYD